MEFLKEWKNYEKVYADVISAFSAWWRSNLEITSGTLHGTTEEVFGLPYTSSGMFAELGNTNCQADYRYLPRFHFERLAVSADGFIVAQLWDNNEEELNVVIGETKWN